MAATDLPIPPDFAALEAWAGPGRVSRPAPSAIAGWQLPAGQKAVLTSCGVPLVEGLVDLALFTADPLGGGYRLAGTSDEPYLAGYTYLAEPETGAVSVLREPGSGGWFVNSTINHWLCSLHLVGTWLATSTAIRGWDEDPDLEHSALAELADLLRQITVLDPAAYGDDGDHTTHFWPVVLDRWLY